jgi:hypothetical protein
MIDCGNDGCVDKIERREKESHQQSCGHRMINCDFCNYSIKVAAMSTHLERCPKAIVSCECGFECTRDLMTDHREKHCPLTEIQCDVIGCASKFMRRDREKHQDEAAKHHVHLLSTVLQNLSVTVQQLEHQQIESKHQICLLSGKIQQLSNSIPFKWRISNLSLGACSWQKAIRTKTYDSPNFDVFLNGNQKLYISAEIGGNKLGLHLHKDFEMSTDKGPLDISGTSVSVSKAGLPDIKLTFKNNAMLSPPNWGMGWSSFLDEMALYIDNDGINVNIDLKIKNVDQTIVL